jgi:phage shock protein E
MNWKTLVWGAAALLATWMLVAPASGSTTEAKAAVAAGARLIDVRTPEEFAAGHIPNAINIPVSELGGRLAEVGPKDKTVVVYCRSGARSSRARQELLNAGFKEVINLGAMSNW